MTGPVILLDHFESFGGTQDKLGEKFFPISAMRMGVKLHRYLVVGSLYRLP
jgi:hypothetical protein